MKKLIHAFAVWALAGLMPAIAAEPFRFQGGSKLPLIVIDTAGQPIPNEPKIAATFSVIHREDGRPNTLADKPSLVTGIRIEVRGSSSQQFEKKSYRFESVDASGTDTAVSLLGMPRDSDWILYGPYTDKSLMRNHLVYGLSNKIGRYAPRTRFVEVFLRDSQAPVEEQYVGVYLLLENIKRGKERVDAPRLIAEDGKTVSGGYVIKIDRVGGPETYFTSELGTVLGFVSPRGDRLTDEQRAWIRADFSRIERRLAADDSLDPANGYEQVVDSGSFIDCFLLNELFKNVDSYYLSTYLHKGEDGKLHMGPVWDFDLSSGSASYRGAWHAAGWMLFPDDTRFGSGTPFWWDRLFEDPGFRQRLVERWRQLRREQFSESALFTMIDDTAQQLDAAQQRNFERWPILGNYVWPNPRPYSKTYAEEIRRLKDWFARRMEWMDANIEPLVDRVGQGS